MKTIFSSADISYKAIQREKCFNGVTAEHTVGFHQMPDIYSYHIPWRPLKGQRNMTLNGISLDGYDF